MDLQTAKDYIEDLQSERATLLAEIRQLKSDLSMWTRIGHMVFTHNEGCLPGCRRACMCTCGFEHYRAQLTQEEQRAKRNG